MSWQWPWVSRRQFDDLKASALDIIERESARADKAVAERDAFKLALEMEKALHREQKWRRMVAEGRCSFVEDRVKRSLSLMLPYTSEEPVTTKRKAIPE